MSAIDLQPGSGLMDDYRDRLAETGRFDELFGSGRLPEHYESLGAAVDAMGLAGLLAASAQARRLVHADGITYGSTSSGRQARNWILDPLPVIIGADEWAALDKGLRQRATLLDLILNDLYGDRQLLRRRVLPAEIVLGHGGFIHQADGIRSHATRQLTLTATDLGRASDGTWVAFADRTSAPSGVGYAMANRRITSRVLGGVHRGMRLTRMRPFFHRMTAALRASAGPDNPAPQVVLLSPGTASETAYDQSFLATLLGFPLVEAGDLTMREGKVWIRNPHRPDRVDVVLRRVDSEYLDPLELRADSELGLAGIIESTRLGHLSLANPVGSGVLENPGLVAHLPAVARELLGEDLLLDSVPTWWCGDPASRSHVLANLGSLVIKPLSRDVGASARFGWLLSKESAAALRARIEQEPWAWTAQEPLPMSTTPVVSTSGLEPRPFVLRTFGVAQDDDYHFLPGGLGRAGATTEATIVTSMAGAIAKDVWVLAPETAPLAPLPTQLTDVPIGHGSVSTRAAIAPRAAESLYWVGRYSDRAESTARLLRVVDDLVEDHANWPGTPGEAAMRVLVAAVGQVLGVAEPDPIRRMVVDPDAVGSVAYAVSRLVTAAQEVRDVMAYDLWHVLSRIERLLADESAIENDQLQPLLLTLLESMLALSGIFAESMVREESWAYLDAGTRMERAQHTLALLRSTIATEQPPIIDGQVTEAVLEAGESIIMHRRRTATGEGHPWPVQSAVDLLLIDASNPRAVAFQLDRFAEDMRLLDDTALAEAAADIGRRLRGVDVPAVCAGERQALATLLDETKGALLDLSARLQVGHFARKPPQHATFTDWSGGRR